MEDESIIVGQGVRPEKRVRARQLRRQMTPAERTLWAHVRDHRMCGLHFRRQQVIDGFIADFYCHAARLVIEVDGPVHVRQADYDRERDRVITARGLQILRFTNDDVRYRLTEVLEQVAAACD